MSALRLSITFVILQLIVCQSVLPLTLVSNVFSSNMVLQRAPQRASIWGWTTQAASVTITVSGPTYSSTSAVADNTGKWMAQLVPTSAGGPYNLTIASNGNAVLLQNVLFGDVLYCSGQSNMAYGLNVIFNGTEESNLAPLYPHIRYLDLPEINTPIPYDYNIPNLVLNTTQKWLVPTQKGILSFSAICWLNARHLSDSMNNTVPLGLINNAWAGTAIERWISPTVSFNNECSSADEPADEISSIYNTLVYPLFPLKFTTMYWYQGEANVGDSTYSCKLARMVLHLREKFENDFAFVVFQLAPRNNTGTSFAVTREQQRLAAVRVGNSCTVSNIDLGDEERPSDPHPRTKGPLGWRSHLCTRKIYYNQLLTFSGPLPKCTVADPATNSLTVHFYKGTVGDGLQLRDVQCPSFATTPQTICRNAWELYNGTTWYKASYALSADKQSLILTGVTLPTNLSRISYRNGYAGWPLSVLYNSADLPPPSFVMNYQPDCSVDEVYEPPAIPINEVLPQAAEPLSAPAKAEEPSNTPLSGLIASSSAVLGITSLLAYVALAV